MSPKVTIEVGGEQLTFDTKKKMMKVVGRQFLANAESAMTLRQLYYRFVAADLVENKQSQYQYLSESMKEARLEGTVPWDWIEDRTRGTAGGDVNPVKPKSRYEGNLKWFKETPDRFERPRWEGQEEYVEVWVEKEALAGVFSDVCDDLNVITFPCRGYSSITLLRDAADRMADAVSADREASILYFGDFDPTGQDIERNIRDTLRDTFGVPVDVERQALTRPQIDEWELPPQPAKRSDARYETFVDEHGSIAVELDALPPEELQRLIREAVAERFDSDHYESEVVPREEEQTEQLQEMIDGVLCEDDS